MNTKQYTKFVIFDETIIFSLLHYYTNHLFGFFIYVCKNEKNQAKFNHFFNFCHVNYIFLSKNIEILNFFKNIFVNSFIRISKALLSGYNTKYLSSMVNMSNKN